MNLLKFVNNKALPLILSAAILINVQIPLYAQQNPYVRQYIAVKDNTNVVNRQLDIALNKAAAIPKTPFTLTYQEVSQAAAKEAKNQKLSQKDYDAIYSEYTNTLKKQDIQVAAVTAMLRREYNPESLISYYQGKTSKNGIVCEGKLCYPVEIWMHGLLRVIIYQSSGQDNNHKQFKNNRDIMLTAVPHIYNIVTGYGLNRNDVYSLQKYLRVVIEGADKYCDNDTYMADIAPGIAGGSGRADARQGKERRQNECANIGKAMITLGMIGPWEQDKNQNAKLIYTAVKDTYKDDYGAITLSTGINALMAVDNATAYTFVDSLLTKDTLPAGTTFKAIKQIGGQILDLLSVSAWASKGIEAVNLSRGGGGRYLNDYNQGLQYIDDDYSRASGLSDFSISVAKTNPSLGYNVSYRNVLEDIGIMLAQAQNHAARNLSQKIVSKYLALEARRPACLVNSNFNIISFENCSPGRSIHMPLVTGILQGSATAGNGAAAKFINTLDWWDLNEGTQRRINNTVTGKYGGTVKRNLNEAKKKRNDYNQKIATASFWADVLVSAVFITALVKSIPSMARSVSNMARTMRVTVSGKGNLLKITRARIAAGGVNPELVKVNIAAKYKQVKSMPKTVTPKAVTTQKPVTARTAPQKGSLKVILTDTKGVQTEAIASYSKNGKITYKVQGQGTASPKIEGTLQESKTLVDQKTFFNNLTTQIGEGSGAGGGIASSAVTTPVKQTLAQPSVFTSKEVTTPFKSSFIKPRENNIISADRVRKAILSGNISYFKDMAGQFMHTLRSRTGAMAMAVNLSLANPVMLNSASAGKIMPMIETISSYDRAAATIGKVVSGARSLPVTEMTKVLAKDINLYNVALNGAKTETLLTPKVVAPALKESAGLFTLRSGKPYAVNPTSKIPKYVFTSYLWLSTLTLSPTPAKPIIYLKEDAHQRKIEYNEKTATPFDQKQIGYQSLSDNADAQIMKAMENGAFISDQTIDNLATAFEGVYSRQQLKVLSSEDNLSKLMMISGTISKSLFDRMLAVTVSVKNTEKAETITRTKSKKALDKLITAKKQDDRIFNNFFDAIMLQKNSNPYSFFTVNSEKSSPKENINLDVVVPQDDLAPTMVKSLFKTKSIKDVVLSKLAGMNMSQKDALMARLLEVSNQITSLEAQGYSKGMVKPVIVDSQYQWEEVKVLQPQNIVLSFETDKGSLGLEIAKWIEKRNIPNDGNYFKHLPAWTADQLGLTAQNPGRFVKDEKSFNYFIYNADGTARMRFGPHEINPVAPHIHIERLSQDGEWKALMNEAYHDGPSEDIKAEAERARSLFEQDTQKTETQLNRQAAEVGKTFMPVAAYIDSKEGYKIASDISSAADKPAAVKELFKTLEDVSLNKYFLNNLNELKAQGLVK